MGFLEGIGKRVADAGQKTVQKTKEMSDVLRLESLASKEEARAEQIYSQIGRLYLELHADSFEPDFADLVGAVQEAELNIQTYRQQVEEVKNSRAREEAAAVQAGAAGMMKCPSCGADIPEGGAFCTSCGKPVPQPETDEAPRKRFCTVCGALLASDAVFCESCGTKAQ